MAPPAQPSVPVSDFQVSQAPPGAVPGYPGWVLVAPPKKDNTVLIIVAVVVVLALVLIVPILYVLVSGLGPNPQTNQPSIFLQAQNWHAGGLVVNVQSATGAVVDPTHLTYVVQDRNGTTVYSGAAGLNALTLGTRVNVTFQDNIEPQRLGGGDSIRFTVTPPTSSAVEGGRLRLFTEGNQIAAVALP